MQNVPAVLGDNIGDYAALCVALNKYLKSVLMKEEDILRDMPGDIPTWNPAKTIFRRPAWQSSIVTRTTGSYCYVETEAVVQMQTIWSVNS